MARPKRKMRPDELRPLSERARLNAPRHRVAPMDFTKIEFEPEQARVIEEISLSVFTDCVNAGLTFQEALSAIYMTGIENAISAAKEGEPGK